MTTRQGVPLVYHRLTADNVLDILREEHRQSCANGDAWSGTTLGFDTTVQEWEIALLDDFGDLRAFGRNLNEFFETDFSDEQWLGALEPWDKKMLRDVCELVATEARVAVIEPVRVLGRDCLPAGAFRVIRERLASKGFDMSQVWPSTPLSRYTYEQRSTFCLELIKLAPGKLPEIILAKGPADWCLLLALGTILVFATSIVAWYFAPAWVIFGMLLAGVLLLAAYVVHRRWHSLLDAERFEFVSLRDFRDVSYALVGQPPPNRAAVK